MEAVPTVEDVLSEVKKQSFWKVVLLPLMIVAGDHATNDMSGDNEDSWKSIFTREGYEVECVMRGTGYSPDYPGSSSCDHYRINGLTCRFVRIPLWYAHTLTK